MHTHTHKPSSYLTEENPCRQEIRKVWDAVMSVEDHEAAQAVERHNDRKDKATDEEEWAEVCDVWKAEPMRAVIGGASRILFRNREMR